MSDKKLTKRHLQALNTKDKLYRTAMELIEKKGFENTTVEDICKTAGVSVGSFYNSFKSKTEILDRTFLLADVYFLNVVASNIGPGSTQDKIIEFFDYYADYNLERGIDHVKQLYTTKNNLFTTKGRSMQAVLQAIIDDGQSKGEISMEMTSEETVRFLFIAVRGIVYDWCLHNGDYDLSETVHSYVSRLVRTLT